MNLAQKKCILPVDSAAKQESVLSPTYARLEDAGFEGCLIRNKMCPCAVGIHPARDKREIFFLDCNAHPERLMSVPEAGKCTQWENVANTLWSQ